MVSFFPFRSAKKKTPKAGRLSPLSPLQRYRVSHQEREARKKSNAHKRIRISLQSSLPGRYRLVARAALAALALLAAGYLVFFSGFFTVSSVSVQRDALTTSVPLIQSALSDVVGRNLLLVGSSALEERLYRTFPEVKAFEVEKLLPRTIKVTITEYPVVAKLREQTTGTVWLLNEIGQVVKKETSAALPLIEYRNAYQFPFSDVERQFTALTHLQDGTIALAARDVRFILEAREHLRNKFSIGAKEMPLYPLERELHVHTDRGWQVWLDMDQDVAGQLDRLAITAGQFNAASSRLAYADLRVKGRIIYCLRFDTCDRVEDK